MKNHYKLIKAAVGVEFIERANETLPIFNIPSHGILESWLQDIDKSYNITGDPLTAIFLTGPSFLSKFISSSNEYSRESKELYIQNPRYHTQTTTYPYAIISIYIKAKTR